MHTDRTEDGGGAGGTTGAGDGGPPAPPPRGPVGPALELLVHGVGGATPAEMLRDACPVRVSGDHTAAVHRREEDVDAEGRHAHAEAAADAAEPSRRGPAVVPEAYCWSNLTSGNSARALWLLLLPFMVVNLAHWMRPVAGGRAFAVRLHGALVRVLALSLTVLLVAAACQVALDLVAWQCAGTPQCADEQAWIGFLAPDATGDGGWWTSPGRRLALAALVPTALTALLWWLSHRTWSAYESQPPWRAPSGSRPDPTRTGLADPGFWYGRRLVARLRAAHTAAGLLTVAAALAATATRHDRGPEGSTALNVVGWGLVLLIAACGTWALATVCSRGREGTSGSRGDGPAVSRLPAAAVGVLVLTVVHCGWPRPGWESTGRLPGDETFGVLAVAQALLVAGIAVIGWRLHRAERVPGTVLAGLGAAATAMLACALGGVMSGGVAQRVADWLDGSAAPGTGEGTIEGPPTVLTWQATGTPVLLCLVLVLLCVHYVRMRRAAARLARKTSERYPGAVPDAARSRAIGRTLAAARVTDFAPRLVGGVAAATLVLGAVAVLGTLLTGETPGEAADGAPAPLGAAVDWLQTAGSWLMGFGFLLLLAVGRRAYQDASTRRTVGILWDVGTFWPRGAHPFAPPCYAERAVPDLVWRMATWTREHEDGRLVLSGHSQGSVLAAAAVWQLDPTTRRQVALLTYGSPLARLYGRWFPAYFGPDALGALRAELGCWRNLWRDTDPIGGPVLPDGTSGEVDRGPLTDPLYYGRTRQSPLPAPILGHSEYQADPAFARERAGLLAGLHSERVEEGTERPVGSSGDCAGGRALLPGQKSGSPAPVPRPGEAADQERPGRSSG